jgi:hypothetical protein
MRALFRFERRTEADDNDIRFRHNHAILSQYHLDRNGTGPLQHFFQNKRVNEISYNRDAMHDQARYFDVRSGFWRDCWAEAQSYEDYLAGSDPERASPWKSLAERLPALSAEQRARVRGFDRRLHVLLVSGVWCGDCVRQGPMIRQLVDASDDGVSVRVIDRDRNPKLRDEVRILGAARVPVVVFLSEDFHEIGRFGDRLLHTYRRKAETELGAACAVPTAELPPEELAAERDEWAAIFERMLLMARLAPPLRERHGD